METKQCVCAKPNLGGQAPPHSKWQGKMKCLNCDGLVTFPKPESVYKGNDPVEGYLFDLNANSPSMTFEKALLTMMLRVESKLTAILKAVSNKGTEKKGKG